ncbi:hypothetical protein HHK36_027218 [Tetracentron sinense]|uniref:isopentenyl-diphosphate Delta-isomerase n=1 Tax=Tetracentron sinense TaxID=13715 RepID=A0A835D2Y3_TETSI|nr:hypothetical protein HHK36_027218 [Tetracentron sinense]
MSDSRKFVVEAKHFEVQGVGPRTSFSLKITETTKRGLRSSIWVPEEAIRWMEELVKKFTEVKGYGFQKFRGRKCTLIGEKSSNVRGEFITFQAFLGNGAGGRIIIPKGIRNSGWAAFISALGSSKQKLTNRGKDVGTMNRDLVRSDPWRVEPREGLECHIERGKVSSKVVVDLDAGAFHGWTAAVVCSIGGPQKSDNWEEVTEIISILLPGETNVSLFPFEAHRAIFHTKNASQISELCRNQRVPMGRQNFVGFRRWWPASNSLSFTGLNKPRWVAVKGIPFHLWVPMVLAKIGALCGGLLEVHPSTVDLSDLSFAKIKVAGDLGLVPRVISIVFHSISYPLEINVWEEELCENCQMWPESMEIRYCRSWVVAKGEVSEKAKSPEKEKTRVLSGLETRTKAQISNSNSKVERARSVHNSGTYGNTRQTVRETLPNLPTRRDSQLTSAVITIGNKKKQKRKKKNQNKLRNFRRMRMRWQRREPTHRGRSSDDLDGVRKEPRFSEVRDFEEDNPVYLTPDHVLTLKGCCDGPVVFGPNPMGQKDKEWQAGLEMVAANGPLIGLTPQPSASSLESGSSHDPFGLYPLINNTHLHRSNHAISSGNLGENIEMQESMEDGVPAMSPLFRQVQAIIQRHRDSNPSYAISKSLECEKTKLRQDKLLLQQLDRATILHEGREQEEESRSSRPDFGEIGDQAHDSSTTFDFNVAESSGVAKASDGIVMRDGESGESLSTEEGIHSNGKIPNSTTDDKDSKMGEMKDKASDILNRSDQQSGVNVQGIQQTYPKGLESVSSHQIAQQHEEFNILNPLKGRLWGIDEEDPEVEQPKTISGLINSAVESLDSKAGPVTDWAARSREPVDKIGVSGFGGYHAVTRGSIGSVLISATNEAKSGDNGYQRSATKVTFPLVWTNTCCSHPLYRESELIDENSLGICLLFPLKDHFDFLLSRSLFLVVYFLFLCAGVRNAAQRKLWDELGIPAEDVPVDQFTPLGRMLYKAPSDGKWGEHELDYLLFIVRDVKLNPNPDEIADVKYVNRDQLKELLRKADAGEVGLKLSPWFRLVVDNFLLKWWDNVEKGTLKEASDMKTIHRLT